MKVEYKLRIDDPSINVAASILMLRLVGGLSVLEAKETIERGAALVVEGTHLYPSFPVKDEQVLSSFADFLCTAVEMMKKSNCRYNLRLKLEFDIGDGLDAGGKDT
jgi:hypothetical protein